MKRYCIYGAQYGSEGKGCVSEFIARQWEDGSGTKLAVFGEPGPNSGHTCSLGSVRNVPAGAFYADYVILGPDSAVNFQTLLEDITKVKAVNPRVQFFLHESAAVVDAACAEDERIDRLADSIASTGSGSGAARMQKSYLRQPESIVSHFAENQAIPSAEGYPLQVLNRFQYLAMLAQLESCNWIFECSQGVLLDTSWGIHPYVTSRCTLPRVAIERNGLGGYDWKYLATIRVFPIRTGGNSGPTGAPEMEWRELLVDKEVATVTKRVRRIFKFSEDDLAVSTTLARPDGYFITHADYLNPGATITEQMGDFALWFNDYMELPSDFPVYVSFLPSKFIPYTR